MITGFDEDASVILRTLVEIAITLGYISNKPDERADRFIEYEYINQYRLLQVIDKHFLIQLLTVSVEIKFIMTTKIINTIIGIKHNGQIRVSRKWQMKSE